MESNQMNSPKVIILRSDRDTNFHSQLLPAIVHLSIPFCHET